MVGTGIEGTHGNTLFDLISSKIDPLLRVQIRDNFWVFDKYFHNQSPLNPMNVYGSPLHPCGEILNVNCSGIESGTRTVHACVLAARFVYLVLDDSHIGTKW